MKGQILLCTFFGLTIALGFLIAARIENIGYTFESIPSVEGGSYRLTLNPFLHLGGGTVWFHHYFDPMHYVISSSISPGNLLLYLLYGELSSFSLMGIFIAIKKRLYRDATIHDSNTPSSHSVQKKTFVRLNKGDCRDVHGSFCP